LFVHWVGDSAVPALAEEGEGRFPVGGFGEEGEEVGTGGGEKAEIGACGGEGEVEFVGGVGGVCEVGADVSTGVVDGVLAAYGG
jgi:hypothetical protein